jgi:hypothetical protein
MKAQWGKVSCCENGKNGHERQRPSLTATPLRLEAVIGHMKTDGHPSQGPTRRCRKRDSDKASDSWPGLKALCRLIVLAHLIDQVYYQCHRAHFAECDGK